MATAAAELPDKPQSAEGAEEDMEVEKEEKNPEGDEVEPPTGNGVAKRARENGDEEKKATEEDEDGVAKRQKVVDKSFEEERMERLEDAAVEKEEEEKAAGDGEEDEKEKPVTASIGPKTFTSSVDMFNYFYKLLHTWSPNLDLNKYEHMVLLELLKKGHPEPYKKIGDGIQAFQVRFHPLYKSRCFFLVRSNGTTDDFSFRKCVDAILPLPEDMKAPPASNKKPGGRGGGRASGGRGGRGRGGRGGFRR